ncbi:MAG: aldehyde dehydrogenase family protein [Bacteroidetes bacterium]|nr:aldehyde dehydrogenase family protein [Bacteroidota bacterium]MBI3482874.1 aldehyde dehydrogenase family protein [Bacteroidota bacterium]
MTADVSIDFQRLTDSFEKHKKRSLLLRNEPLNERKRRISGFEGFLMKNRDRIAEALGKDFKKPKTESDVSELYPVLTEIRHALAHLEEWSAPQKIDAPLTYLGTRSEVRYEPKGVCLIIAPWNFPINLCFGPLISCLAAGNTAIIKPSEMTPHTSRLISDLVKEFFEEDLVTVVEGGQNVSEQLLELPFDHIFFTGSPAVGKLVMKAAAENLTSVTLELGGKSPAIIDASANISDTAKRIAFGKFLNNGQTCIAPDYVLVEESVQQKFVEALKIEIQKMFGQNGVLTEASPHYARIVNRKHFDRLNKILRDAIDKGAKVESSGPMNSETNFIHPVVLSNVAPNSLAMQDEIFGPILPVIPFKSVEQVTYLVNGKPKPLALYIFSSRKSFQEKILLETSAGSVGINECVLQFTHPNLPFGGVNSSGIGKSHGRYGFLAFSNEKPVLKQKRGFAISYLLHPPYTNFRQKLVSLMLKWF